MGNNLGEVSFGSFVINGLMGFGDELESRMTDNRDNNAFEKPSPVDPILREKLGIFGKEESIRSPSIISLDNEDSKDSVQKYRLTIDRDYVDLSNEETMDCILNY